MAESGWPQIIRRHDTEVAVVISIHDWKRAKGKRPTLVEVLRNSPLVGLDLDFSRQEDYPRDIDLGGYRCHTFSIPAPFPRWSR